MHSKREHSFARHGREKLCFSQAKKMTRDTGEDGDGVQILAKAMIETTTIKADEDDPDR